MPQSQQSAVRETTRRKSWNLKYCWWLGWVLASGLTCDSHGGKWTGELTGYTWARCKSKYHHWTRPKVLQELISLSCPCLDKTRPWLWFPRRAVSEVHFPPVQGLKAKLNNREKAHSSHTHRWTLQGRAVACQHPPEWDHHTEGLSTICSHTFGVANQVRFCSSLSTSHLEACLHSLQVVNHCLTSSCSPSRATQPLRCHSSSSLLHKQTERWQMTNKK